MASVGLLFLSIIMASVGLLFLSIIMASVGLLFLSLIIAHYFVYSITGDDYVVALGLWHALDDFSLC
jgi:hypothetical protein